jgi:uncharacterized membrane protein
LAISFWANLIALSALAIACLLAHPRLSGDLAVGAVLGGLLSALGMTLIYAALAAATISLVAPLIAVGSALLPTLAATISGQAPNAPQVAGIAFSLIGVVVITRVFTRLAHRDPQPTGACPIGLASVVSGMAVAFLLLAAKGYADQALAVSGFSRLTATGACLLLVIASRTAVVAAGSQAPEIIGTAFSTSPG